ncbi:MAG TPA: ABC transporter ATP-binding protein [Candidatus Dormibacteraeota bacterium]|nr:ABC transporter ATP-binding protein [Candidatus Dormibacteraeota bacterium]
MAAIVVEGLRKSYGDLVAVDGVSFAVEPGEVFGLLGPNGAGKTTTVEILEGYRRRDGGTASVLGVDPQTGGRALKQRMGLVLQELAVPPMLTVRELVEMYRGYYPAPRATGEIIELVGLSDKADVRVKSLSGGQQRRIDLALGLVGDPELVFLDEPTTGFDPSARRNAWEIVRSMRALGKTILLTTHYMDEAQELADRICVMARGRVVAEGKPDALRARADSRTRIRFALPPKVPVELLPVKARVEDGVASLETTTPTRMLRDLTVWAVGLGLELDSLEVVRPSLEDVYLELTRDG